jgi:acyl-CoA synthetase (AMP-forming)/AMP-acid ligase II
VTFLGKADHLRAVQGDEHLLSSCGKPGPLGAVKVVDDAMNECNASAVGEIVVRGEQVMSGYWANEEGTNEAMAGGWFHTGDMAYRDEEGFLYIVDRKKDMIVTGGENVYSKEVEDALFEHDAVLEAAIIGLPDETWGERVTAVVVLRPGATASEADIIASCKARLAGYKAPKTVILTAELPKNATGKVLKRQLRDTYSTATTVP